MFNKHKVTSQGKKVYEQTVCFSSFNNDVSIRKTDDASWLYKYINKSGILTIYLFEGNDFFVTIRLMKKIMLIIKKEYFRHLLKT